MIPFAKWWLLLQISKKWRNSKNIRRTKPNIFGERTQDYRRNLRFLQDDKKTNPFLSTNTTMKTSSQQKFASQCVKKYSNGWRSVKSHRIDQRWTMVLSSSVEFWKTSERIGFWCTFPLCSKWSTSTGAVKLPFEKSLQLRKSGRGYYKEKENDFGWRSGRQSLKW